MTKESNIANTPSIRAYANLGLPRAFPEISKQKETLKMEKKTIPSVTQPKTDKNIAARHIEINTATFTGKSNNNQENQDIAARTPLESRFLAAQADLGSSRQRLLRRIFDESNETFFLSSREMARRYKVDSATIVRTIQALGYKKFADFAHDLREHFVAQITPYTAMKAAAQKNRSVSDYVRQSVDKDLENLNAFRANLNPDKIVELAKQINRARRIVVIGIDFAASLAGSLAYGLVRLGVDAEAPAGSSGIVQNKIRIMIPEDLLVAISFGRGLRETVEAAQRARRQNVPTFGITDSDATPIAKHCDAYLVASIARTSFIDSYVASVAAINAIIVACAHSQSARALELLRESEEEDGSSARWYREPKNTNARRS